MGTIRMRTMAVMMVCMATTAGSAAANGGIFVDNPFTTFLLEATDGSTLTSATAELIGIEAVGCDGRKWKMEMEATLDLKNGELIELPDHDWCSLALELESGQLEGNVPGVGQYSETVPAVTLVLDRYPSQSSPDGFDLDDVGSQNATLRLSAEAL